MTHLDNEMDGEYIWQNIRRISYALRGRIKLKITASNKLYSCVKHGA